jgi:hypothetical protein
MLKTFVLIAALHGNVFVLDSGLSADDCMTAIMSGVHTIQLDNGELVSARGAHLACEVEDTE